VVGMPQKKQAFWVLGFVVQPFGPLLYLGVGRRR
jgi:hypothetical protein